ncbi:FUSC family protein [Pseudonocardia sp. TRM90224]|uniref:FUSC family protein n=1 Tax=Pseudonocardia sp. TRM90224 TaxID=2812678 RepID=UPI0027E02925|nr:FUSC family protein [Pseudonocardia sp. TRM90224]
MKALAGGARMLVMIVVVVGGTVGLGAALGLGNAMILAGLIALFCFIAAMGGPLRPDLRLLAVFAPAVVIGAAAPRLLGEVSHVAAIALLTVVLFVAGLLPALGTRFVTVGLGLGMASVFGYGFQLTGTASVAQIVGAPVLAIAVVIVLRLLLGIGDPTRPTRTALADALVGNTPGAADRAVRFWLADRPVRWHAGVFGAGMRARAMLAVLDDRRRAMTPDDARALGTVLDNARAELVGLADAVRAKTPPSDVNAIERPPVGRSFPGETAELVDDLWTALQRVREAVVERDGSPLRFPEKLVGQVLRREAEGTLSWRSAQLRHAVRCALGMLIALVVAGFRPGDPLTVTFLMTTFAIMQPEWRDTLSKAWQRVGGALGGAVVLTLAIWLLPQAALLPLAIAALLVGMPFMQTQPVLFNGCMVLMAVGMNASTRNLDPVALLVEYVLLMALAVVIALLFGFATVPGVRKPSLQARFAEATGAARDLLAGVAGFLRGTQPAHPAELGIRFRAAARAEQDLLAPEPGSAAPAADQTAALEEAAEGLRGLAASAGAMVLRGDPAPEIAAFVEHVAEALDSATDLPAPPEPADDEQRLVMDMLMADVLRVRHGGAALAQ